MITRLRPSAVTLDVLKSAFRTYIGWQFLLFTFSFLMFGYFVTPYVAQHEVDNKDLSNLFLTYNALVLSFSLASITLVIALPSREFVLFLAKERDKKKEKINPLKNLILSFFQAAFAHYVALTLVLPIFLFGPDKVPIRTLVSIGDWTSAVFLMQAWAFLLFGLALRDIASLGVLYATHLAKTNGGNGNLEPPQPPC